MQLQISSVSKTFAGRNVLRQLSLSCGPGESLMVIGGNGSGKSTLLKIAAGLLEVDAGSVVLCGERMLPGSRAGRRHVGFLPDAPDAFPDLTVRELAALADALKQARTPASELEAWVSRLDLEPHLANRLRALSFGQRKRAFLLSAVIGDPWLLILDEPSNGLDPLSRNKLVTLIHDRRAAGKATLISSNDLAFVEEAGGRVCRLVEGALTAP